ncbi:MAG: NifB/NifX family molybdenum-iron cluster-binding protein [Verrucomicrobia bacterium]|nr:NifB/NifX family molybdenum-iron cluster-binding protein [Verrucomicrobiota bacterium]
MKIAFTATGDSLAAPLDPRFGRAPGFLIYDDEAGSLKSVNNEQNLNAAQGAGIQSALLLCKQDIDCVVTGHCGPKAFQTLTAANIKVYPCKAKTIEEAYAQLKAGELTAAEAANAEAHWV